MKRKKIIIGFAIAFSLLGIISVLLYIQGETERKENVYFTAQISASVRGCIEKQKEMNRADVEKQEIIEKNIISEQPPEGYFDTIREEHPLIASTGKDNTDESVSFFPVPNMTDEEVIEYANQLFKELVWHPETIAQCGKIFTLQSMKKFEEFKWYYANPEKFYEKSRTDVWDIAEARRYGDTREYSCFWVVVMPDFHKLDGENNLDETLSTEAEAWVTKWMHDDGGTPCIDFGIEYERKTGVISIQFMEIRCRIEKNQAHLEELEKDE